MATLLGEAVDLISEWQGRLRAGSRDGQRGSGVGPGIGGGEPRQGDCQRTVEGVAGADGVDGLDPGAGTKNSYGDESGGSTT